MSGITEDAFLGCNAATRRLYDPAFKLFRRTIPVSSDCNDGGGGQESRGASANLSSYQHVVETPDSEDESSVPDELGSSSGSNDGCDEQKMAGTAGAGFEYRLLPEAHVMLDAMQADARRAKNEQPVKEDGTWNQAPKRPGMQPIHCPRCKSLDTKFCYFNNYNANQPRHFCKNCQRYWTAGGTLRDVPVGAGRRKNKHSGAHARSMLPDAEMVRSDPPGNAQHFLFPTNPVLMQPGQNSRNMKNGLPPCNPQSLLPLNVHSLSSSESSPSSAVLSSEQESPFYISTGIGPFTSHRPEVLQGYRPEMSQAQEEGNASMNVSPSVIGIQMEQSTADEKNRTEESAFIVANESSDGFLTKPVARQTIVESLGQCSRPEISAPLEPEVGTASSEIPKYVDAALAWASSAPFSFMGGPWPYGANLGWPNALAQGGTVNPAAPFANLAQIASSLAGANPAQQAGVQPPWAAAMGPCWAGGMPMPWPLMQNPLWGPPGWGGALTLPWAAPFMVAAAAAAAAGSTMLGKHPREQGEAEFQKVLVPKTLRIDDPGDAARSSIWSTLGLSLGSDKLGAGGIFGDYSKKPMADDQERENAQARSSNPAGFDRSASFQEKMVASWGVDHHATEE